MLPAPLTAAASASESAATSHGCRDCRVGVCRSNSDGFGYCTGDSSAYKCRASRRMITRFSTNNSRPRRAATRVSICIVAGENYWACL
ncbi:hypothetical protein PR003_g19718 [Phytophthora rubi]|uniref:Uncharacterized protein n=1 Tax=Phytophthora rubi TaxID=129364 RepID=A0A6A4DX30_9STRA|nr:hypothetical protein PR003_g19718 [Phytophthora rubi]